MSDTTERNPLEVVAEDLERIEYLAADPQERFGAEVLAELKGTKDWVREQLEDGPPAEEGEEEADTETAPAPVVPADETREERRKRVLQHLYEEGPKTTADVARFIYGDEYTARKNSGTGKFMSALENEEFVESEDGFWRCTDAGWELAIS